MNEEHLKIIDLSHRYGSHRTSNYTLKSINLNLRRGELIGLVGPSGCGKTTLLRLIAGFESPSDGQIVMSGVEISNRKRIVPPEKRGIGMVFQDYALFPHLNVWKNVCFGLSRGSDFDRPKWLLDLLGLSELTTRYPHELSGGQRQRLALARALAPGSSIVLLDEPFNSLDFQVRHRLRNELSEVLKTCSATAIFVTHDSQEALSICDRVAVMRDGQLHQCASPDELINNPSTSFVGEFVFQKNILPVKVLGERISTPIGTISLKNTLADLVADHIMFDSDSLEIDTSLTSNAVVKSREIHLMHSVITLKTSHFLLRVNHSPINDLSIGDSCHVKFKSSKMISLFPSGIKCFIS